jgi:hypothetical protein
MLKTKEALRISQGSFIQKLDVPLVVIKLGAHEE